MDPPDSAVFPMHYANDLISIVRPSNGIGMEDPACTQPSLLPVDVEIIWIEMNGTNQFPSPYSSPVFTCTTADRKHWPIKMIEQAQVGRLITNPAE